MAGYGQASHTPLHPPRCTVNGQKLSAEAGSISGHIGDVHEPQTPGVEGIYDQYTYFEERRDALERLATFLLQCQAGTASNAAPALQTA